MASYFFGWGSGEPTTEVKSGGANSIPLLMERLQNSSLNSDRRAATLDLKNIAVEKQSELGQSIPVLIAALTAQPRG